MTDGTLRDLRWPTYPSRGVVLEAAVPDDGRPGAGCLRVRDVEGKVYLDAIAGIGTAVLGHAHPAWVEAIQRQLGTLGAVANTFGHRPQLLLAARLAELFPITDARCFFTNSGTEATEAAIKLALRATKRDVIVTFEGAFHGRTLGAIALTANPAYRAPYVTCYGEDDRDRFLAAKVLRVAFDDIPALEQAFEAFGPRIAAVFVEPIQGEGGVWPASEAFLLAARALCDRHGALLGLDEVQCGCGRTGAWSAWTSLVGEACEPDIIWLAKALGGGFPIGACLTRAELAEHMGSGSHGSTFGGNPVACTAGLATLRIIEAEGLLARAGAQLPTLERIAAEDPNPEVTQIRGLGAMIGVQLGDPDDGRAAKIEPALRERGLLATTPGGHTVRLLLPYAAGEAELREAWSKLRDACSATPK